MNKDIQNTSSNYLFLDLIGIKLYFSKYNRKKFYVEKRNKNSKLCICVQIVSIDNHYYTQNL